jgi:hypothetical protein
MIEGFQLQVKGLSEAKIEKMREAGGKICPFISFKNAKQIQNERVSTIAKISSGSSELDKLIGGGFETGVGRHTVKSYVIMPSVSPLLPSELN